MPELPDSVKTTPFGLTVDEAAECLARFGPNVLQAQLKGTPQASITVPLSETRHATSAGPRNQLIFELLP
jgi:hypothetical protein